MKNVYVALIQNQRCCIFSAWIRRYQSDYCLHKTILRNDQSYQLVCLIKMQLDKLILTAAYVSHITIYQYYNTKTRAYWACQYLQYFFPGEACYFQLLKYPSALDYRKKHILNVFQQTLESEYGRCYCSYTYIVSYLQK